MREPTVDILYDDAGVLVCRADGQRAADLAVDEMVDYSFTREEAVQFIANCRAVSRYWRKIPANQCDDYAWTISESRPGSGAFYGTWFQPIPGSH